MLFPNAPSLESQIEAVDVLNDEYVAYNASGLRLKLDVNAYQVPRVSPTDEHHPEEIRDIILSYYDVTPGVSKDKTLNELIEILKGIYRYHVSS